MLLVMVDANSKWLEVGVGRTYTAEVTVGNLCNIYTTHCIPQTVVSDKGPFFFSEVLENFCRTNGIHNMKLAPDHPHPMGWLKELYKQ